MKSLAVQKAINVIKMEAWTHPADFRYQDETSEYKISCDRVAAQKLGRVYVPKPWEGLPYLTKDDLGKVYVRGFLHDGVAKNPDGTFCHPGTLSTTELLHRLSRAWKAHSRKHRETQISHQRLVFSLSKEFHDAIVQAGRNPDMVLRGAVERTMRAFQEKFHPGDSVGYSYGLHHDTDNLHAHVFIQLHPNRKARSRSDCHRLSFIAEILVAAKRLWSAFRKGIATAYRGCAGFCRKERGSRRCRSLLAPRLRLRNHWPRY